MMPFSVVYRLKSTPGNSNPVNYTKKIPENFIKEYGQSPMAAKMYAEQCFSLHALDLLEVHDSSGCLLKLI